MTVTVEQGAGRFGNWFLTLVGIGLVPICVAVYNLVFSIRRWKDSDYSPYGGG